MFTIGRDDGNIASLSSLAAAGAAPVSAGPAAGWGNRMVDLLATCAMLWLGATAAALAMVIGLMHLRQMRRGGGRMQRVPPA